MEPSGKSHEVKRAYELDRRRGVYWFVVECICGWSSPLCSVTSRANELYAHHKAEAQSMEATKGTES